MDHPFRGHGPLYLLLLAFLAGFFLGLAAGPAGIAVSGVLLLAALGLASIRFGEIPLACAVAALCGSLTAGRVPLVAPGDVLPYIDNEVLLEGRVEEVRVTDSGWAATARGSMVSLPGGTNSIRLGTVLLYIRNPDRSVSFPARVRAAGRLHPVRGMGNPGEIPRELSAMSQGAQYAFSADAAKVVFLPEAAGENRWRNLFPRARRKTGEWVKRVAGTTNGSLYLLSLATGEVPPYSHPMVALLRRTGLAHLLAISGVNVVIFHIITVFLLRAAMWAFRRRHGTPDLNLLPPLLALPASWAYVFLAGAPTPAVRSAGMITVAVLLWRRLGVRAPGVAWTGMLLLTLGAKPTEIVSPSFLLSYGATFFLIANYRTPPEEGEGGWRTRATGWVKEAVGAATVAFLGTLPVSAAFFQAVPSGAILWNVLFGPILGTAGVAGAVVAVVGGAFGVDPLAPVVRIVADGLTVSLTLLDRLSGSGAGCFPVPPAGIAWPAFSMAAAVSGTILLLRRGRRPWPATVLSAAIFLCGIHAPYAALPRRDFSFTALNVGKGASHVVSFPGGGHMLIDGGSALRGNAGARAVLPFLRSQGIRRIDVLALTHPHEDHFGGAAAVLAALPVREIWIPEGIPREAFGPAVASWTGPVRTVRAGDRERFGGAEVVVRAPANPGKGGKANERGMVLELRFGILSMWLPGDVEGGPSVWGQAPTEEAERRVLFLPHHGSPGADPAGWTAFCRPIAVVAQNSRCFTGGNLIRSPERFLLENGAFTVRSYGLGVSFLQSSHCGVWKCLLRLM
ncbi:ComEC/Rec2 family competence protein [Candidatus Deferrimicrobium sp.]|uniref:ComEC/Rec2 family competence protein n=1 Tax=Candidatus Deferrimicrobium sp. TaxID=3060586 RepID=UPI003C48CBFD